LPLGNVYIDIYYSQLMSLSNLSGCNLPIKDKFDFGLYNALVVGYSEGKNTEEIVKAYRRRLNK